MAAAGPAVRAGTVPDGLRPGGEFDQYVAGLAAKDQFSGSLLITHKDRAVLARAYGKADQARAMANRPDTIFALASVTKIITAVAVMQLAQQGKIVFTRTLDTYLDGFPADIGGTVTVHDLLVHTSGMGDFMQSTDYPDVSMTWSTAAEVMDGTMAIIRKSALLFTPGTRWGYSNSGYVVLGAIVAKVSGLSYYDYVRQQIFGPAGMTRSDFYTKAQWQSDPRIAHSYALQPSGQRADTVANQVFIGNSAGGAFATTSDLVRFARAFYGGRLLSPAFTELCLSGKFPMPPLPGGTTEPAGQTPFIAYGPQAAIFNNQRIVGGAGSAIGPAIGGITTVLDMYPDLDWTVVILNNYDQVELAPLVRQVRHLIAG
jgi:CubicO group peptidase (beta-lactamase class C family)